MTTTSDMRYGRQGGRFIGPPAGDTSVTSKPWPSADRLRRHLEMDHAMPADVLDQASAIEHKAWHEAEHRNLDPAKGKPRHAGHLDHTHPR